MGEVFDLGVCFVWYLVLHFKLSFWFTFLFIKEKSAQLISIHAR